MPLVELTKLSKHFGGLVAVDGVDIAVEKGEIFGLIGPNGAGKTTLFNLITGFLKPSSGKITFESQDITGSSPEKIAAKGIVRTFQATVLFREMSVFQNVVMGHYLHAKASLLDEMLGTARARHAQKHTQELAAEILAFMGIDHLRHELAKNLPHGHQRILGMAIAMAASPKLLLLDEPATGMNPEEARQLNQLIGRVKERGTTIIIVEHDMKVVMEVCDRIAVLNFGQMLAQGRPDEIRQNREVIEAYLGKEHAP